MRRPSLSPSGCKDETVSHAHVFSFQPSALPPSVSNEVPISPSRMTKKIPKLLWPTNLCTPLHQYLFYIRKPPVLMNFLFRPPIRQRDVPPPLGCDEPLRAATASSSHANVAHIFSFSLLTCDGDRGNDADLELDRSHGHYNWCAFGPVLRRDRSRRRGLVARLRRSPARCWGRLAHARAGLRTARPPGGKCLEYQHRRGEAAAVASDEGPGKLFVAGAAVPVSRRKQHGCGGVGALDGFSWGGGRTGRSNLGAGKVSTYCRLRGLSVDWTDLAVGRETTRRLASVDRKDCAESCFITWVHEFSAFYLYVLYPLAGDCGGSPPAIFVRLFLRHLGFFSSLFFAVDIDETRCIFDNGCSPPPRKRRGMGSSIMALLTSLARGNPRPGGLSGDRGEMRQRYDRWYRGGRWKLVRGSENMLFWGGFLCFKSTVSSKEKGGIPWLPSSSRPF